MSRRSRRPAPAPQAHLLRSWAPAFGLLFLIIGLWSLATPLGASPDEPAHVLRAVSLDRGQLIGPAVSGPQHGFRTDVRVPGVYVNLTNLPACFIFKPDTSAACSPALTGPSTEEATTTYVGRYPPLFYAAAGLPSLFTTGVLSIRLMRLVSALLCAALLALAWATARRWSSSNVLACGVLVAATAQVLFLAGTVNPSGLELAATITLWTAAATLVAEHRDRPPGGLLAVLVISGVVTALARGDSPAWLGLVAICIAPLAIGRLRRLGTLAAAAALGILLLAVVGSLLWIFLANGLDTAPVPVPMHNTLGRALTRTLDHIPELTTQAIGNFGWTDTPTPWLTDVLWYVALGAAVGIGVLSGRVRELVALLLAFAAYLALPLVLTIATWQSSGYALQGRYILPAAIGIPILALASPRIGRLPERATRRVTVLIGLAVGVAQVSAFHYALRRYHVGDHGPIFGTAGVAHRLVWNPPLGATVLDLADVVCWVGLVTLLVWAPRRRAVLAPTTGSELSTPVG